MSATRPRVAVLHRGPLDGKPGAPPEESRTSDVPRALERFGMEAAPLAYREEAHAGVRDELLRCDGVLVWINPIQDGLDRSRLDPLLRDVAAAGVFVSTHPDVILKLGTKEVLHRTRHMGWGDGDTQLHADAPTMQRALAAQMAAGQTRIVKQVRGNGGDGVWKVEPGGEKVRVRHARRGSPDETLSLGDFVARCAPYFAGGGCMINQPYQRRLPEGMTRCYLTRDKVVGFGHQAVNALCPPLPGAEPGEFPATTQRVYHPPTKPEFQALKRVLEARWVPELTALLGVQTDDLPILWDCDFLLGERDSGGQDTHVLCEINVSCVSPFPRSALDAIAQQTLDRTRASIRKRSVGNATIEQGIPS